jgi:hypothetical protein
VTANREYKDSAFRMLFSDRDNLIDLYNALTGSGLPSDTAVEMVTLEGVFFNKWRDDVAFVVNGRLVVLIEHQSTVNENMPLRFLIYLAHMYEKIINNKAMYNKRLVRIPRPEFIVLYNGTEPFPEEKTLRLSDAYMESDESIGLGSLLELEVRVLNINKGHNLEIMKDCESLR